MSKYKVLMEYPDGKSEELDEVFDSWDDAEEYALSECSAYIEGAEVLNLSNPGDYPPLDMNDTVDFEIFEID